MAGGGGNETTLEDTPTWIVALVCAVIIAISVLFERILHVMGKCFVKKGHKFQFQALQKAKAELMLMGFISLLLAAFQDRLHKICIPKNLTDNLLPCKKEMQVKSDAHLQRTLFSSFHPGERHLLAAGSDNAGYCENKGKAPLLSLTAVHDLHIFIFVLAITYILICLTTILLGKYKINQWKSLEDSILKEDQNSEEGSKNKITDVHKHSFIAGRYQGFGKCSSLAGWLSSFFKQFYGHMSKSDYTTMRRGFINYHFRENPQFNFHKHMMSALEADFKKVIGISWYLWVLVVALLVLNVHGWHAYFWISFIPLILVVIVGTKLEHIIIQLAQEVADKHAVIQGDIEIKPSDDHFWFKKPRLVLILIQTIIFLNSFNIAIFFFVLVQYNFHSCIMGPVNYLIARLVIGVFVQFLCSYSTLPLYAIVTQMGSGYSELRFSHNLQETITNWAERARRHKGERKAHDSWPRVELAGLRKEAKMEEGGAREIESVHE